MSAPSGGLWPLLLHRNHAADGGRGQDSMGTTLEAGVWSMFGPSVSAFRVSSVSELMT